MRLTFLLMMALMPFLASAQNGGKTVDKMPEYPGGIPAIQKYLTASVSYPEAARNANVEGRVLVRFTVTAEGKIENAMIENSVHPALDSEAVRVVRLMPKWQPGLSGKSKIPVEVVIPIVFGFR